MRIERSTALTELTGLLGGGTTGGGGGTEETGGALAAALLRIGGGISSLLPHFGHDAFLPAAVSGTVKAAEHIGQLKRIMVISLRRWRRAVSPGSGRSFPVKSLDDGTGSLRFRDVVWRVLLCSNCSRLSLQWEQSSRKTAKWRRLNLTRGDQGELAWTIDGVPVLALNLKTYVPEYGLAAYMAYCDKQPKGCSWIVTAANGGGLLSVTAGRWDRGSASVTISDLGDSWSQRTMPVFFRPGNMREGEGGPAQASTLSVTVSSSPCAGPKVCSGLYSGWVPKRIKASDPRTFIGSRAIPGDTG
jgi:hypothetical protein